jgi:sugar lactone lactonase YvrE
VAVQTLQANLQVGESVFLVRGDGAQLETIPTLAAFQIVPNLAALALALAPNGGRAQVLDQNTEYVLDTANTFAPDGQLIVAATGGGNWFRRSKSFVVGNFFLWAAGNKKIIGLGPGQLALAGPNTVVPDIVLDLTAVLDAGHTLLNVTPDTSGNLWSVGYRIVAASLSKVYRVPLSRALASGAPVPDVILQNSSGVGTAGVWEALFDKTNSMWLVDNSVSNNPAKLLKIAAAQYATSGTPTALAQISALSLNISAPQNCCFDAYGNIWLANFGGPGGTASVSQVSAAQLAVPGASTVVPPVVWSGSNFVGPSAVLFAPSGLLWVADYATGGATSTLKAFDPTQATGNPAPTFTITCADFFGSDGLAFDAVGNLWLSNGDNGKFVQIAAADLTSSGLKVARSVLTQTAVANPGGCSFSNNVQRSGLVGSGAPVSP